MLTAAFKSIAVPAMLGQTEMARVLGAVTKLVGRSVVKVNVAALMTDVLPALSIERAWTE